MRSVSSRLREGGALLLLLVALAASPVYAEDGGSPFQPPEARIRPPGGFTSDEARVRPPVGVTSTSDEARGRPPVGVTSTSDEARARPPVGVTSEQPGFFEMLADWFVLMARVRPPIG